MPDRPLSPKERSAVRRLKLLAREWSDTLGLFSWSGSLVVVRLRDGGWPHDEFDEHVVATVYGIQNGGGDPD